MKRGQQLKPLKKFDPKRRNECFSFLVKVLSFVKERKFEDSNIKPLKRFDQKALGHNS